MPRIPQVTRTLTVTEVKALCLDLTTGETLTKEFTLPRTYKNEPTIMKTLRKKHETDTLKIAHIVSYEVSTDLYGQTEEEFVEHGHKLDKRSYDIRNKEEN